MADTRGDQILARFAQFHRANPIIWELFKKYADEAAHSRTRYSARTIIHRVRWHVDVETKDTDRLGLKINNDFSPYYARMYELEHPEHEGIFERRKLKSREQRPFKEEPGVDRTPPSGEGEVRLLLLWLLKETQSDV